VNAYPGLLKVKGWTAGLFALWGRDGDAVLGIHFARFPIGLAGRP